MRRAADRALKWLLPALVLLNVSLVRFDVLDPGEAIMVVAGVELLALLVGGQRVLAAVRRYRRSRSSGLDVWEALEDGLAAILPRPLARVLASSELRLPYYLVKWVLRRTSLREGEFSYHRRSAMSMFLPLVLLVTPIEILLLELLLPWLWLQIVLLVLAFYSVFWVLGLYASLAALPHRLEDTGLRLHHGILAGGFVPYAEISRIESSRRRTPNFGDGLQMTDGEAYLAASGSTNVTLKLRAPRKLDGFLRPTKAVGTIHLAADDPGRLVGELRSRVEGSLPAPVKSTRGK